MTLRAESVSFAYRPGMPVLRDVTCEIEPGRVTAILGPNGSGKTTLLRLLLGFRRPSTGHVRLNGLEVASMAPGRRASRMAYMAQRPAIAFAFSVREVVALGRHGFAGRRDAGPVERGMERAGVSSLADAPIGELSVGQQQLVGMARALAQLDGPGEGKWLLADEPLSALDPAHTRRCQGIFRALARDGVGVGIVIHDVTTAVRTSDRTILLTGEGSVGGAGATREVCEPSLLAEVYAAPFVRSGEDVLPATA